MTRLFRFYMSMAIALLAFCYAKSEPTDYPSALVEALFLSSTEEESMLADPKCRQQIAQLIFHGLQDYLKQCKN